MRAQAPAQDGVTQELCGAEYCYGCMRAFQRQEEPTAGVDEAPSMASFASRCPQCRRQFCFDCDTFVHETLHNCPGCENGELRQPGAEPRSDAMAVD